MDQAEIADGILHRFADVHAVQTWGETAFFYNPGQQLPRGVYFATLKNQDGDNDRASALSRQGVFRLNLGMGKSAYRELFGPQPARPAAGGVVATGHDFTALDQLMPHPVYGWMSWVCVLNPSAQTVASLRPLLEGAYDLAVGKFQKRIRAR